jgi:hypothetical protein
MVALWNEQTVMRKGYFRPSDAMQMGFSEYLENASGLNFVKFWKGNFQET